MQFVCDIHNHISVKTYLYNDTILDGNLKDGGFLRDIIDKLNPNPEVNVVEFQTTLQKIKDGGLSGVIASHYIPEFELLSNLTNETKFLLGIAKSIAPQIYNRVEKDTWRRRTFEATIESFNVLEKKLFQASVDGIEAVVVKDYQSLMRALQNEKIVILHSVEGAHQLGRVGDGVSFDEQLNNLHTLSKRGVSYLTLAHFFSNDFVKPVQGLPPHVRTSIYKNRNWKHHQHDSIGLLKNGSALVEEMLKIGMIVDLTHSGRAVRDEVYKINDNKRPLIFSHTGVQSLFQNTTYPTDSLLGVSDTDIKAIKDCNGVIGVIFYNYWLVGKEEPAGSRIDFGLEHIYNSIQYIYNQTKTFDNISIGTDFDGMTDPPDDISDVSYFSTLRSFLLQKKMNVPDIEKIMGGNMLRVLQNGWR
ncbi:MAG: membrane dipeptidase [Candidatus Kapaibacterium sp.]